MKRGNNGKNHQNNGKYVLEGLEWEGTPDAQNPEWTKEDFKKAKKFKELPKSLQAGLLSLKKRGRPPVAAPKKVKTFKLSPDLIDKIITSGKGYNARVEQALREAVSAGKI